MADRILIDLLSFTGSRGGTEAYAREIVTRLPEHIPGAELIGLVNRQGEEIVREFFPGNVQVARWVGADRVSWAAAELLATSRAARNARADVIWSPANFGPISGPVPRVVTVHDTIYHEAEGHLLSRVVSGVTAWLVTRTALSADAVISVSDTASQAIEKHIGVPASKIFVIPHGTLEPKPPADPWSSLGSLDIRRDRPVILSTGNRLPHKNFEGLLRAVATIEPSLRPMTVISGGRGRDPLASLVEDLELENDVRLVGWVSEEQLESLYAIADVYVCPSLAEGFGLPVIDAMRRDCVVIANDIPVLREVGGTAALYADASSPVQLGHAISRVLHTAPDLRRKASGRAWSSAFTWEQSARRTADVLLRSIDRGRRRG